MREWKKKNGKGGKNGREEEEAGGSVDHADLLIYSHCMAAILPISHPLTSVPPFCLVPFSSLLPIISFFITWSRQRDRFFPSHIVIPFSESWIRCIIGGLELWFFCWGYPRGGVINLRQTCVFKKNVAFCLGSWRLISVQVGWRSVLPEISAQVGAVSETQRRHLGLALPRNGSGATRDSVYFLLALLSDILCFSPSSLCDLPFHLSDLISWRQYARENHNNGGKNW